MKTGQGRLSALCWAAILRLSSMICFSSDRLVGERLLQRVFVRARIDDEKQVALLHKGVVFHRKLHKPAADLRSDLDEIRPDARVIGARVAICFQNDEQQGSTEATITTMPIRGPIACGPRVSAIGSIARPQRKKSATADT